MESKSVFPTALVLICDNTELMVLTCDNTELMCSSGEVDLEEGDTSLVTEVVASEDEHRNGTEFGQFPTAATNFYPKSGTDESTLLADVSVNFKGGIRSGQIAPPEIHR